MFADQRSRDVAEGHARVHRISCEQATGQGPLTARIEQSCELLQIDRNALLIAIGSRRTDGEDAQGLCSAIEGRDEVSVNFVRRETPRLASTKMPICDEDSVLTDSGIRNQIALDPHGDVQTDVAGVIEHEVAQIDAIVRRGRDRLGFLLE